MFTFLEPLLDIQQLCAQTLYGLFVTRRLFTELRPQRFVFCAQLVQCRLHPLRDLLRLFVRGRERLFRASTDVLGLGKGGLKALLQILDLSLRLVACGIGSRQRRLLVTGPLAGILQAGLQFTDPRIGLP